MSKLSDYSKFDHIDSDIDDDDDNSNDNAKRNVANNKATTNSSSSINDNNGKQQQQQPAPSPSQLPPPPPPRMVAHPNKKDFPNRFVFEFGGRPIYEWEQSLDEVIIYVPNLPDAIKSAQFIDCQIQPTRLKLGLNVVAQQQTKIPPILDHTLGGTIQVGESTWSIEQRENNADVVVPNMAPTTSRQVVVYLTKSLKGEVWSSALVHDEIDTTNTTKSSNSATAANNSNIGLDHFSKEQVQKEMMLQRFQEENPGMDFRGATFNGSVPDPRTFMGGIKYS